MPWWTSEEDDDVKKGVSTDKNGNLKYGRLTETEDDKHMSEFYDIRTGMTYGHGDNITDDEKKDFGNFVSDAQDNTGRDSYNKK